MKKMGKKEFALRSLFVILSIIVMGLGLSILIIVEMGTDPFSCMGLGISRSLSISYGNTALLMNGTLFIVVILKGRRYIGVGTIANMVLIGYAADFFGYLFRKTPMIEWVDTFYLRIIIMIIGLIIFTLSAAMYMSLEMGTSPYDAVPFLIADKLKKIPFRIIRMTWDFTAIVIGYLLGSTVGVVTIGMALLLGPLVTVIKNLVCTKLFVSN